MLLKETSEKGLCHDDSQELVLLLVSRVVTLFSDQLIRHQCYRLSGCYSCEQGFAPSRNTIRPTPDSVRRRAFEQRSRLYRHCTHI